MKPILKQADRLFSVYKLPELLAIWIGEEKCWVITEADRSVTMVLFPGEN